MKHFTKINFVISIAIIMGFFVLAACQKNNDWQPLYQNNTNGITSQDGKIPGDGDNGEDGVTDKDDDEDDDDGEGNGNGQGNEGLHHDGGGDNDANNGE